MRGVTRLGDRPPRGDGAARGLRVGGTAAVLGDTPARSIFSLSREGVLEPPLAALTLVTGVEVER